MHLTVCCIFILPFLIPMTGSSMADSSIWLDNKNVFKLNWNVEHPKKLIHFKVTVRTIGWIAFGISKDVSRSLKGADIVIGWVGADGKGHLKDCHSIGNAWPVVDAKQDYHLTGFSQNNNTTVLKFQRKLVTGDIYDNDILPGTTKLIYSWGGRDPARSSFHGLRSFRLLTKGSRSVDLLSFEEDKSIPTDTEQFSMTLKNAKIPPLKTVYWCALFKISDLVPLRSKKHIVEIAPVIQKRSTPIVHHMLVSTCQDQHEASALNYSGPCYDDSTPDSIKKCAGFPLIFAWGRGGAIFKFPDEAGLPIGPSSSFEFVVLSIHFNNPMQRAGLIDNSGLRFYYTSPRKYDATMLITGANINSDMLIPPKQRSWLFTGYCTKDCSMKIKGKNALNGDTIKIFASLPHAHRTATSVWTSHVRNGTELAEVMRVDNFNFKSQQLYSLRTPVEFKAGDELLTYCRYNTMNKNVATLGGDGSTKEMCINFMMYYPKSDFSVCSSDERLVEEEFAPRFNKKVLFLGDKPSKKSDWSDVKWNSTMVEALQRIYQSRSKKAITSVCVGSKRTTTFERAEPRPFIRRKLRKPRKES